MTAILNSMCKSYNFETKKLEVARGFNLFQARCSETA